MVINRTDIVSRNNTLSPSESYWAYLRLVCGPAIDLEICRSRQCEVLGFTNNNYTGATVSASTIPSATAATVAICGTIAATCARDGRAITSARTTATSTNYVGASIMAAVDAARFYYSSSMGSYNKHLTCKAYKAAQAMIRAVICVA